MTVWELAKQGLSLAGAVWDGPFLFSLSQSLPQIPLSEVRVTTSQTIDLPWDQPNNYRGLVDSVCFLGKLNFGWAAPHALTRVPYGWMLAVNSSSPPSSNRVQKLFLRKRFQSTFGARSLLKTRTIIEWSWQLGEVSEDWRKANSCRFLSISLALFNEKLKACKIRWCSCQFFCADEAMDKNEALLKLTQVLY